MRRLYDQRDEERLKKELSYSSMHLKNRLSEIEGGLYLNEEIESQKEAFLRRKSAQGRTIFDQQ